MKPWKSPWFCSINRWPQSATWSTQQVAHWAPGKDPWRFGTSKVWWYICIVYVCDNENNLCIYYILLYITPYYIYTLYIYYIYIFIINIYRYTDIHDYMILYVCIQVGILSFPSTFFIWGETLGKSGALGWVEPAERWAASVPRRWFGLETPWQLEVYNGLGAEGKNNFRKKVKHSQRPSRYVPNLWTLGPGSLAQRSPPKMNPFPYQAHP